MNICSILYMQEVARATSHEKALQIFH